jgi:hypothetical protein
MIEYVLNVFISITTKVFSFLVNYDFESRMNFDHISLKENTNKERVQRIKNKEIVFIMKKIWKFVKTHMKKVSKNQVTHVNKHKTIVFKYQIENQV